MDHFIQIPQAGREWEDLLESYTTLGFLAGVTSRVRLGTLVTGVTYRNVALLGKMIATLDVVSGGRAIAGLGAAWYEREHVAYGFAFPPLRERYALLEDALELLPLMWGKGTPAFKGRVVERARSDVLPAAAARARPDPRRRIGREEDAAPRGAVRRRLQPVRRRQDRRASKVRGAARAHCATTSAATPANDRGRRTCGTAGSAIADPDRRVLRR